jgi:hypothetical protein
MSNWLSDRAGSPVAGVILGMGCGLRWVPLKERKTIYRVIEHQRNGWNACQYTLGGGDSGIELPQRLNSAAGA